MYPSFLPTEVEGLTEQTSVDLAQQIQQQPIATSLCDRPIDTAYACVGEGKPPLLLLHGFDSSLLEFRRLVPLLAPHYQTWVVDLLGFGFTDRPAEVKFSPAAIKTHLYQFWQEQMGEPMVLVGASMGGAAAIDFTLTYPEAVDKLVLIDSAGFAAPPSMEKLMFPPIDRWATGFLRNPGVRRRISVSAYHDRSFVTPDAELCASLHLKLPRWSEALISFTTSGGYNFLVDKIANIEPRTLILWGEDDRILGKKDATKFEQAIAHSELIWIPDSGHVSHLERPQLTAQSILSFQ